MKKKIFCLALLVSLVVSGTMTSYAADNVSGNDASGNDVSGNEFEGSLSGDWVVRFTQAGEIEDNLGGDDYMNEQIAEMEPGDKIVASVTLGNSYNDVTYWYMKNSILASMEAAGASGGAYGYKLIYIDPTGVTTELFNSRRVGADKIVDTGSSEEASGEPGGQMMRAAEKAGEGGIGLEELKNDDKLNGYSYLGELAKGQSAQVILTVELDGETQGNSYQDKVANLSMNFAVEPRPSVPGSGGGGGGKTHHRTVTREVVNNEIVYLDEDGVPLARNTDIVKTSDETNLFPYVLVACISGLLLLIFAFMGMKEKKEDEGGAAE